MVDWCPVPRSVVEGFNSNALIKFGGSNASGISCVTSSTTSTCNVRSPTAHGGSITVGVTAANLFKNGAIGPTSAPVQYQYFAASPPTTLKNCQECIDTNRQCIKVAGGFQCKGLAQ